MKKSFFIKLILGLIFIGIIIVGGISGSLIYKGYKELPDISKLIEDYSPAVPTVVYDRNGKIIDIISKERRKVAHFNEIPSYIKEAFLAIEDKKFYEHHGIHIKRLLGAIVANIRSGSAVQGASSFTQQLAKNAFLTNEKSITRKVKEALITFEIERKYTKDEIFEKYLNEIYFGGGAYGVRTAAEQFFQKDISQINLPESALLAGIPNRPEKYNPNKNLEASIKRMKLILTEMYNDKMITEDEYNQALNHKFYLENKIPQDIIIDDNVTIIYNKKATIEYNVPDFSDIILGILNDNFDEKIIYNEGLKVYTTLDLEIQKIAKKSFEEGKIFQGKGKEKLEGGMVTVDPNNGHIISIVGGRNYKAGDFNRGIRASRQLGSSFKPFLYLISIKNGFELNSIVEDKYLQFGKWIPKNYGNKYNKNLTLLWALDRSVNTVSIQLLNNMGISTLKKEMKQLDENLKIPNDLTASLGSFENTPLNHSINYSIFANGGYKVTPIFITKIEDKFGNILYQSKEEKVRVFDSLDTSIVTYMLKSSVLNGSSYKARVFDKNKRVIEQGGKTGTTNENRTLWYAGITPQYITTIYVGFDNNKPIEGKITGGTGVAPIWGSFYQKLVNNNLLDTNSKFLFLDNHVKNKDLYIQKLTLNNGVLSNNGRAFLIRQGKLVVESENKYKNGLEEILKKNGYKNSKVIDENMTIEDILKNENQMKDNDYIFNGLLGN